MHTIANAKPAQISDRSKPILAAEYRKLFSISKAQDSHRPQSCALVNETLFKLESNESPLINIREITIVKKRKWFLNLNITHTQNN